ncbi:ADP-ribose pyrophosphatase, mitochondrial [Trichinella sp. T9]|uniref:ADP-ribose pyrophosphatase, mitochondrial n=1 Tax=Trichinella murrelli TaxID=144512 RepID=A0A0V0U1U6_9BILA|nr:ADP-ribose pyrophosphatase, mitochondrial [Trichinella murrelli]KRX56096.1 ADP-ribose pyrophosphatase, mitochondrial [Trichinella sp. T9]
MPTITLFDRVRKLHTKAILRPCKVTQRKASKALFKEAKQNKCCCSGNYPGSELQRVTVPNDKIAWEVPFDEYKPLEYSAVSASVNICGTVEAETDPIDLFFTRQCVHSIQFNSTSDDGFNPKFNTLDGLIDRRSCTGEYLVVDGRPLNPVGRTGIAGKGSLARWGPNHRVFVLITRLNMEEVSKNLMQADSLEFTEILACRSSTGTWSLPNGFVNSPHLALTSELDALLKCRLSKSLSVAGAEKRFRKALKHKELVLQSYYDDSRNTDNAWVEVTVYEFAYQYGFGDLVFENENNTLGFQWRKFSENPLGYDMFK